MKNKNINLISIAIIYIIGSFFAQGLKFIALPIFSKILPASDFGLYSSFESWIAIITVIVGLQATGSIANAYIDYGKKNISKFIYSISVLGILSAIVVWILLTLFRTQIVNFFEISYEALSFGILQCLFTYFFTILINKYRMLDSPVKYLIFSIGNSLINITLSIIFIYCLESDKYLGRVYASTIAAVLFGIIAFVIILKSSKSKKISMEYIKYALKLCIPLIYHAFAMIFLNRCDQMMILKMQSSAESGIYSYGNNYAHIIYVLYTACNQAFIPWYYKRLNENKINDVKKVTKNYILLFTFGFLAFISILPDVIKIISSEMYYNAIYTAPIVSLAFYFSFLYTFPVNYEFYKKKTYYIAIGTIFAAVLNAIFNYILIPEIGSIGASISTATAYLILLFAHYYVAKKIIKGYEMEIKFFAKTILCVLIVFLLSYVCIDFVFIRIFIYFVSVILAVMQLIKMKKEVLWIVKEK